MSALNVVAQDFKPSRFAEDRSVPLHFIIHSVYASSAETQVYDVTYSGSQHEVPASLMVPKSSGRFAAILWAHWLMPGSPTQNRKEFLDEAIALAPSGVVSLLIDAPQNRPGFKAEEDPLGPQQTRLLQEEVLDLRRGLDLLLSRDDVDPQRVAFVGHSLGTMAGAVLDAVDKRFRTFVFMAGPQSVRELVLFSKRPGFDDWRKQTPGEKINAYLNTYAWADPATYAPHFGPAPALFQYALKDDWVTVPEAKHYLELVSGPKVVDWYESGHALNGKARLDRFAFLRQQLGLASISEDRLTQVPQTR